jgi:hypothetical protein
VKVAKKEVVRRVHAAYDALIKHDRALLEVDANERSITHKLAEHLQTEFPGWNVDCEYNRNGVIPKRLLGTVETVLTGDTDGKTVFPDIIVHHRKSKDNLVVIEAKKSSTVGTSADKAKLEAYVSEYGYQLAFIVVFTVGSAASNATSSSDIEEVTT